MGKVIIKVIIGLNILAYAALFLSWNMAQQEIISWQMMGVRYSQPLPVGIVVFIGLVIGAVIMAIACWSAWAAQKATADKAVATVKKAKVKLQAQLDTINELRAEVEQLEGEIQSLHAGNGTWGRVDAGDIADLATVDGVTPAAAAAEVDDDEVI
jgi:multisubunit Na+/H+ antiporter MnhC subunit